MEKKRKCYKVMSFVCVAKKLGKLIALEVEYFR